MSDLLGKIANIDRAWSLTRAGLTPAIVESMAGISNHLARLMWKQAHECRPPSGGMPVSLSNALSTSIKTREGALFAATCRAQGSYQDGMEHIVKRYAEYRSYASMDAERLPLPITICWMILRDLRVSGNNTVPMLKTCPVCGGQYLFDGERHLRDCVWCRHWLGARPSH